MASLPLLIYTELTNPLPAGQFRIWGAALTLILIVGVLTLLAAVASRLLAPQELLDRQATPSWPKRIEIKNLDIYYGSFHAVDSVTMTVPCQVCHRAHRTLRLRQVHRAAHPQPDARGDPRRARRGQVLLDGEDIYSPDTGPRLGAAHHRHGLPATEPVSHDVDPGQRRCRAPPAGRQGPQDRSTRSPSARCARRTCGPRSRTASASPARACPAVSSSGCASPGRSPSSPTCC